MKLSALAVTSVLLTAAAANAQLGGQLVSTGGMVHIEVLPSDAGYTSELWLYSPGAPLLIATNRDTGFTVDLGPFIAGDELVFGINVLDTGDIFRMGPGSRNADGIEHAVLTQIGPVSYDVGFEDISGGGDHDYNDNTFRFTGEIIPAPAGLPALAMGGLLLARRRR